MKILAIDYGSKNIGLALSDDEKKIAFAYKTLKVGSHHCHSREFKSASGRLNGNPENLFHNRTRFLDPRLRGDDRKKNRITEEKIISDIKNICQFENVEKIIIGLPLWLTGDKSKTTESVLEFARELENGTGLKVETVDERLSTVQANKLSVSGKKNADNIDELSAQILLQGWLEKMEN